MMAFWFALGAFCGMVGAWIGFFVTTWLAFRKESR
jgi:hypothetical protein